MAPKTPEQVRDAKPSAEFKRAAESRMAGLRQARYSFWEHWRVIADYVLPRRYRWLVTPNEAYRGSQINQKILDSTGTIAARICAAGMMSGITSPTRPWFKLRVEGYGKDDTLPVNIWLAEVERRMMRVFAESNFYNAMAVLDMDLVVFATGAMIVYEDYEDVIRCHNPCLGEFYLENGPRGNVDTFVREFTLTAAQIIKEYGEANCPNTVTSVGADNRSAAGKSQEFVLCVLIEPNDGAFPEVPKHFRFREVHWLRGEGDKDGALRVRGYHDCPFMTPRWDLSANDAYGRGPGMDALPDIKQLQQETKRKAQAIDKMVNPPLVADISLENRPASVLPGGVTYVAGLNAGMVGMKPVYSVMPPVQEIKEDIAEVQKRIKDVFFNDLFMMVSQLDTVRTATEIDARREEKLIQLGPVLERFENEALDPIIDRVFGIMSRGGLLPPAPPEIHGAPLQIEYVSMLAEAQRASSTSGIERLWATAGNLAAAVPTVLDNLNFDDGIDEYAALLAVAPKFINAPDKVAQLRKARSDQQQQSALQEATPGMAQAAQTLSKTPVGGGQSALSAMLTGQASQ